MIRNYTLRALLFGLVGMISTNAVAQLYSFTSHTFTPAGATGMNGPDLSMCQAAYAAETWSSDVSFFNMSVNGVQLWTVPETGDYSIECFGAQGGFGGGLGAQAYGELTLTEGQILQIVVGQEGFSAFSSSNNGGGGGGGSFVVDGATPLVIAGGGGGFVSAYSSYIAPYDASISDGQATNDGGTTYLGGGGTGGNGGNQGLDDCCMGGGACGGGGFLGDGLFGAAGGPGLSFLNNSVGGNGGPDGEGGFGGGSGSSYDNAVRSGGGGGYSGGQGGSFSMLYSTTGAYCHGGGGGSYVSGVATAMTAGVNSGQGSVIITKLCFGLVTTVSDDAVCEGDMVTLEASSTGSGVVSWSGGITDGVPFAPPVGTTTYTATSDDPLDCAFSIDIVVSPLPTVDGGSDIDACEGETVTLAGSGTADSYAWDGGVTDGVAFTPAGGTTTFTVTGTVTATGCENTDDVDVNYTMVDEGVTVTGGTLSSDQAGATYQWIDCSTSLAVPGETSQDFTPTQNGDYAVIVTINGCSDTSACEAINGVGFSEQTPATWKVYPNPASTELYVNGSGEFTWQLIDPLGKIVAVNTDTNTSKIDLSGLSRGTYVVRITQLDLIQTSKVIVH